MYLAGSLWARERRYDLVGAIVLTALPTVGRGALRDVLIGGDRSPPFIFKDPTYVEPEAVVDELFDTISGCLPKVSSGLV